MNKWNTDRLTKLLNDILNLRLKWLTPKWTELNWTNLNASLRKVESHGQLFPGEHVWVLSLLKGPLQLVQLVGGEGGAGTTNLKEGGKDERCWEGDKNHFYFIYIFIFVLFSFIFLVYFYWFLDKFEWVAMVSSVIFASCLVWVNVKASKAPKISGSL